VTDSELSPGTWRKSTASGSGNCVEVSFAAGAVLMRHSLNPEGPMLSFSLSEWEAFLTGVRDGEFDIQQSQGLRQGQDVISGAILGS
jgi:hypothetical protein